MRSNLLRGGGHSSPTGIRPNNPPHPPLNTHETMIAASSYRLALDSDDLMKPCIGDCEQSRVLNFPLDFPTPVSNVQGY